MANWLQMKVDAAIKEDRADVPNANKEGIDLYRFQLELSTGHILTAFRPMPRIASYRLVERHKIIDACFIRQKWHFFY